MLRINQNSSAAGATSYYSQADYYTEGQELVGQWRGEGAKRLGLAGAVTKEAWEALCHNRDPVTGGKLTLRNKDNRRVGYDFNFHAPKSLSVLYGLTNDERILHAFRESVGTTMLDIESEMRTRVRKAGKNEDRTTGNAVWGEFVHFTARPVAGVADPHLHAHAFIFNSTWDQKEAAWKAGEFGQLKKDASYFEAVFHSRLTRRLAELGIETVRTKDGWEIAGMPKSALSRFSRRTALIEAEAKRKGIDDPKAKSQLGAKTRERKQEHMTFRQLQAEWQSRLTPEERAAVAAVWGRVGGRAIGEDERAPLAAVRHAAEHWFERKSVVPERRLLAEAIRHAVGKASPEAVENAMRRQELVFGEQNGQRMVTTKAVLAEEMRMLAFARDGRGTQAKLSGKPHVFTRDWLNDGQRRAVQHVLESRDRVILVTGKAGVGKTSMMQEAVEAIEANGSQVYTFAPSAEASRGVLRKEGFGNADTVARLLTDNQMKARIRGQVIWIDEAGLIGTRTMAQVFDLAERLDARVILSGDAKQHGSVERGATLRLLEEQAGLVPAEIKDIMRQRDSYMQAVRALSEGRTESGFRQLDSLGWIREVADADRYRHLTADYIEAVEAEKSALVISPTHREKDRITGQIRRELAKRGQLDKKEQRVLQLTNMNYTQAERGGAVTHVAGGVLEFHQNGKGFRKGHRIAVDREPLPLDQAARFQLFQAGSLHLAAGDIIRITKNGMTADDKHRLNNGDRYRVKGFASSGDIVLDNGWKIAKAFGHLDYGYVTTSFTSQSKTVDRVFIGQSAESWAASSREQFYVSVSRGREQAIVYTSEKNALLEAVRRSDDRQTAIEFVNEKSRHQHGTKLQSRKQAMRAMPEPGKQQQEREEYER